MLKTNILLLPLVAVLALVVVGDFKEARAELATSKTAYVQRVCDKAHKELNGQSEQECADAQDQAGAEYICSSYAANARCWVVLK